MNIRELINKGRGALVGRKTALLDSELLLAFVLGESREYLIAHSDEEVLSELVDLFISYINRVKDGEPLAYIFGAKEFYGLNFYVDNRVLVPRPETEHLVDMVVNYLRSDPNRKYKLVDVGTGSGNIAVSIAKTLFEESLIDQIDGIDIDSGALEVCRVNVEQHGVEGLICLSESDLLSCADEGQRYDVIVANLPYIGREGNRYISADVEKYEPDVALFGGMTGLELYEKMFRQIVEKEIMFELIIGEFGFAQTEEMENILDKFFEKNWKIEKDLAGIDRIFVVDRRKIA